MLICRRIISFFMAFLLTVIPFQAAKFKEWTQTAQLSPELERNGTPKKYFTISFDDGITQDLMIIEICKAHGFYDCTFNINTGLCGEEWAWVGESLGRPDITHKRFTAAELESGVYDGFDVEVHSLSHSSLKNFDNSPPKLRREINADAINIYKYTGVYPLGMAWPGGDTEYTDKTVELISKGTRTGFARATTATHSFALPECFLKWYPTCSVSDGNLLELAEQFLSADCSGDMLFCVWGHGYELDLHDSYEEFEQLIKMMAEAPDVVTVTNAEFYLLFKDEIPAF